MYYMTSISLRDKRNGGKLSTRLFIRTCKNYGDAIARARETKEYYEGLPSVYDVTVTVQKMETTGEAVEV